jgi:hypothetical protein
VQRDFGVALNRYEGEKEAEREYVMQVDGRKEML